AETSASSRRDADEFLIARQELGFPLRFPREARACGARPGFERLESSGIASQGIDRARDVVWAIGIEQGPSPRLLHQTGQFRKRAHSQREPGLEVFEDLVGQAEPVVHRRWPV